MQCKQQCMKIKPVFLSADEPGRSSVVKSMHGGLQQISTSYSQQYSGNHLHHNMQRQSPEVLHAKLGLCLRCKRAKHMYKQTCSMLSAIPYGQSLSCCVLPTLIFGSRNCRNTMMIKLMPSRSCRAHAHELDLYINQTATVATDRPELKMACTKTSPNGGWMVWCGSNHAQRGARAAASA